MYFKWLKKVGSVVLAAMLVLGTQAVIPVSAADNIEIVLTDVTDNEQTTLGEAKVKVSVKGNISEASTIQVAFSFDGELPLNDSVYCYFGDSDPETGKLVALSGSAAGKNSGTFTVSVVDITNALSINGETDVFILSFGTKICAGKTVTLDVDTENTYVKSGNTKHYAADVSCVPSDCNFTFTGSSTAKAAHDASIEIVMDKVNGFQATEERPVTVKITNEETNKVTEAIIKDSDRTKISPLTFMITRELIQGNYTVEIFANGYVPFVINNYDFSITLKVDNSKFVPGDVNGDEIINDADKTAYEKLIVENKYSAKADFNCDGKTDDLDNVFGTTAPQKTKPAKMSKPTVTGGDKKITVSWSAPDNGGAAITGYTIKYGTSNTNLNKTEEITNANTTSKEISSLSADTTYYVQIAAKNEIGTGDYSDVANATTSEGGSSGGGGGGGGGAAAPTTPTTQTTPVAPWGATETFTDLGNYAWAKESIYTLKNKGIISGISETEYAPANNIKRGDFILILTRMLSINDSFTENFADVPQSSYYYNAIGSAKTAGIASGDGVNFNPENSITRQDLITLAYRAFLSKGYIDETTDLTALDVFGDKNSISDYALAPLSSMVKAGIIQGSDGNVNPLGNATRAEVAVMCARLLALMN